MISVKLTADACRSGGKTTVLEICRKALEAEGFRLVARGTSELGSDGDPCTTESITVQRYNAKPESTS